jgi:hypothetical protein
MKTTPRAVRVPPPPYSPRTSSRAFSLASPAPLRTVEGNSLTAHVSPAAMSKPARAMRRRASTPAACQVVPLSAIHLLQDVQWISASAWKFWPSAWIRSA